MSGFLSIVLVWFGRRSFCRCVSFVRSLSGANLLWFAIRGYITGMLDGVCNILCPRLALYSKLVSVSDPPCGQILVVLE